MGSSLQEGNAYLARDPSTPLQSGAELCTQLYPSGMWQRRRQHGLWAVCLSLSAGGSPYPAALRPVWHQHVSRPEPADQLCLRGGDTFLF